MQELNVRLRGGDFYVACEACRAAFRLTPEAPLVTQLRLVRASHRCPGPHGSPVPVEQIPAQRARLTLVKP